MAVFGFSDHYAMFDQTPVDNQFITEYLPDAKGEYVKVYLYGLLQCYHPQEEYSLAVMSHDLGMDEETIMAAYRYWERKRLVERISDNPPAWRYLSAKERMLGKGEQIVVDDSYAEFSESLHAMFGKSRSLAGREIQMAYEWVEDMGLPVKVVLLLVQAMKERKGKNFTFASVQKIAAKMAEQNIATEEEAERFLTRDQEMHDAARRIVARMGKRRAPSEDEVQLYTHWVRELGFTYESVEAACAETVKGDPNFAYLDGILNGILKRSGTAPKTAAEMNAVREADKERIEPLKALLQIMHINVSVNEQTIAVYDEMRILYPDEVILIAGRECARHKQGAGLDDVLSMLESWQTRGLKQTGEVLDYVNAFNTRGRMVAQLKEKWGQPRRISAADRQMVAAWTADLSMPWQVVLYCAAFAGEAQHPMAYLDKLMKEYAAKGVRSIDAVDRERGSRDTAWADKARGKVKTVIEQQYHQRAYTQHTDPMEWMKLITEDDEDA